MNKQLLALDEPNNKTAEETPHLDMDSTPIVVEWWGGGEVVSRLKEAKPGQPKLA